MKAIRSAASIAVCLLITACGRGEYVEAIPEVDSLTLEVTGDPSEGAAEMARLADGLASTSHALTTPSEYLTHARDGVRLVNSTVRELMGRVKEIAETHEGERIDATTRRYGPKDVGNVTYRLFIRKLTATGYGWRLDAKPLGAEDSAYLRVLGGAVRQAEDTRGRRGAFGANLDNLQVVDPSFPGQGVLIAGFGVREGNKTLAYRLQGFTPDAQAHAPVTAAFIGHRRADTGATSIRLAHQRNLEAIPEGTEAQELLRVRARWVPGVGGRGAALATGGDVPEGEAYVGVACWNAELENGYSLLSHCTGVGTETRACTPVQESGARANCRQEVRELDEPALDPLDGALDDDAPDTDVTAPETEPTGEIDG
ncbi:MAG: hypothetical protein M3Y59_22540 [Myxococcota bacterium]|nr:hypothetical protein [Myxococcota bacterium]